MFSIKMIQAPFLLITVAFAVVRGAPEDCCFQTFLLNGTTTVNQLTSDGGTVPMTLINLTAIFAPCETDWTITRETLTVIATDCGEIRVQTRDEPRLTSMGGTPRITIPCPVSYQLISHEVYQSLELICSAHLSSVFIL